MNVLLIGSGGREHCLAWKINQSSNVKKIYAIPGNPGIEKIGRCFDISTSKDYFGSIKDFVLQNDIDYTIVGPEAPLVDGIVDYFNGFGLKIFGPDSKASKIEGSKVFTKNLCNKYKIPTAASVIFLRSEVENAKIYLNNLSEDNFPIVLKVDGLAAGKGVLICKSKKEALDALADCLVNNLFGKAADNIIFEEFIDGYEVSLLNLCDGKNIIPMVMAQDYKKIYDDDQGKNTGGMGSYSPVPFIDEKLYDKILNKIIHPTFESLKSEGIKYKGILYGGIIIKDGEPYLLEYNCRFGDPETQAILPRLNEDLLELLIACSDSTLPDRNLNWYESRCVCVVLASKGYPETSSKGDLIKGLEKYENYHKDFTDNDVLVFHAGTKMENGNIYTNGGRVLNVISKSSTFKITRDNIYRELSNIKFNGMQYRKDIALKVAQEV